MTSKDLISYEVLDVELVGGREGGRGGGGGGGRGQQQQYQHQQQQQTAASAKWGMAEVEVVKVGREGGRERIVYLAVQNPENPFNENDHAIQTLHYPSERGESERGKEEGREG